MFCSFPGGELTLAVSADTLLVTVSEFTGVVVGVLVSSVGLFSAGGDALLNFCVSVSFIPVGAEEVSFLADKFSTVLVDVPLVEDLDLNPNDSKFLSILELTSCDAEETDVVNLFSNDCAPPVVPAPVVPADPIIPATVPVAPLEALPLPPKRLDIKLSILDETSADAGWPLFSVVPVTEDSSTFLGGSSALLARVFSCVLP